MAQNPRFNNSGMFTNIDSNDYSDITPDSTSEVLATQGNVINSIKVFWNKLKAKLAYAVTRPDYSKAVGGNYVPIFVNADGVVQECQPTTVNAGIANSGIITIPTDTIPNENIYTGTTVCINVSSNSASSSDNALQIQHNNAAAQVRYPSGITVLAKDISGGDLLLATFCKTGSTNFWILLNKINTVVSKAINGGYSGLMTADDKQKLDGIQAGANKYSLPKAEAGSLGGIQLGYATNETNRNYKLQTDDNGNGYVNVPWTDTVTTYNRASMSLSAGDNPTLILSNSDGSSPSNVPIVGSIGTKVYNSGGSIVVESPTVPNYNVLKTDNRNSNYGPTTGYLVFGPGKDKATGDYFLAGDGTWQRGTPSKYMEYDTTNSSLHIESNNVVGTLQVKTSTGGPIDFYLVLSSGNALGSSSNKLTLNGNHSISLNRAYPILSRQQSAGVREVRPGFIVFTTGTASDILSGHSIIGTIY